MTQRHHTIIATLLAILGLYLMRVTALEIQPAPEGLIATRAESIVRFNAWADQSEHALGGLTTGAMAPLPSWTSALGILVLGKTPFAVRWFSILCAVFACWMTYLVARRFLPFNQAVLAMICLSTCMPFAIYGRQATDVIPALAFVVSALWGIAALNEANSKREFGVGIAVYAMALGGTLLTVPLACLPVFAFALLAMDVPSKRLSIIGAILAGLMIGLPWYVFMYGHHGSSLFVAMGLPHVASLNLLLLAIEAHPLVAVALLWCVVAVVKRELLPPRANVVLISICLWFVVGMLFLAVSSFRSSLSISFVVLPGILIAFHALSEFARNAKPGLIIVTYGVIIAATVWFVVSSILHLQFSRIEILIAGAVVTLGVALVLLGLRSGRQRSMIAERMYKPLVYGSIGVAVLASVLVVLQGNPHATMGGRAVAVALEEDTLAVRKFVYLQHASSGSDALNGQLAWYTNGWLAGWRPGYSFSTWTMPNAMVDKTVMSSIRGASWVVYYHPSVSEEISSKVGALLGTQYSAHVETPDYTLFRNR